MIKTASFSKWRCVAAKYVNALAYPIRDGLG
jgi:hypothetical protein